MNDNNTDVNSIMSEFGKIKHKILFFFMPESIVFQTPKKNEDPDLVTLKSISPLFYWCSAHEFPEFDEEYKYLIQYQIYSIENQNIVANDLFQKWCKTKYEIKDGVMSFLEMWNDHKRLLLNTILSNDSIEFKNNNEVQDFSSFASFVGKSIFDLKNFYIKQAATDMNFDVLQKEFWKMIALNSSNNIFDKQSSNYINDDKKINKKATTKKKTTNKNKTTKNVRRKTNS